MAAPSSSSSSSSSSSMSRKNYGVFLSFRGDLRYTFISRLNEKLNDKGVYTFIDSEALEQGDRRGELFEAIEGSRIAVVTFSENYGRSKWCLNELAKIMEREKLGKIFVLPVFYKVTPREVRLHEKKEGVKGCFQLAIEEMEAQYGRDMANIWRQALWEGGDLIGESVNDGEDEGLVVRKVVDKVLKILNRVPMEVAKYPTGIDSRLKDIKPLLHMNPHVDDVFMIGINGLGGGGKTTLAKAICNDIADKFDDWCFLQDVRTTDLVLSQQTLLRQLLREPEFTVPSVDQGKRLIKERLCHKRVLVIMDDVDNSNQLDALAGNLDWFGKKSRVIVTTRDKLVLDPVRVQHVHPISLLHKGEDKSLFRRHAFHDGQKNIKIDDLLIDRFLAYAAGLPLALMVLGVFLSNFDKESEWASELEKLDKNPDKTINSLLKISFDGLDDQQKEIFLDIACFFKGWKRDCVMKILDGCGFAALIDTEVLVKRCLVTVEDDDFRMHDLLEVMGKSIVHDEKATGIPSRIWASKDFLRVLSDGVVPANYALKGIVLDSAKKENKLIHANTFKFSRRLRLLIVRNTFDPKEPLNLPRELRWLEWPGYTASTVRFDAFSHLVGLDMQRSNIKGINGKESNQQTEQEQEEEEEELQEFEELKYVNLSSCESLTTLPHLSKSSRLQELDLQGCGNLIWLDEAIGSLDELVHLNLKGCFVLSTFPSSLKSKHFRTLNFSGCFKLTRFPDIEEELEFLKELYLGGTALKELPDSIVKLIAVKILNMNSCKELSFIPASISRLENLEDLQLAHCENLEEVQRLPPHPVRLYMRGCQRLRTFPRLHTFMCHSPRIHFADLSGCQNLGSAYMNESLPYQKVREFQAVAIVFLPAEDIPDWMSFQTTNCGLEFRVALPEGMLEDDILGLALSVTFEVKPCQRSDRHKLVDCLLCHKTIGGIYVGQWESAHTWFTYRRRKPNVDKDEEDLATGTDWSNITFRFYGTGISIKKCGAHVVCKRKEDDLKFDFHEREELDWF